MLQRDAARHVSVCYETFFEEGVRVYFVSFMVKPYVTTVPQLGSNCVCRMPIFLAPNADRYLYKG
jgi:hypothetical protein